jgi:hypothetical protein
MSNNQIIEKIKDKYEKLSPYLNEKTRRIWAAVEARSLGWGGRKLLEEQDAMLLFSLESLIEPMTLGDPESVLKWTNKSVVKLADALNEVSKGFPISQRTSNFSRYEEKRVDWQF